MNEGYIKLHRKIQDSWIWGRRDEWKIAWLWMLMQANWKSDWSDKAGRNIYLRAGEMVAARVYLLKALQKLNANYWTESAVRNFIKQLKKHGMIRTHNDQGLTIISICNYESYNSENSKRVQATTKTHAKYNQKNDQKKAHLNSNKNQQVTRGQRPAKRPEERPTTPQIATIKYKEEEIKKRGIEFLKNDRLSSRLHDMGAERFDSQIREVVDYFNDYVGRNASIDYGAWKPLRETVEHLSSGRTTSEIKSAILASLQPLKQDDPSMRSATSSGVVPGDVNEFNKLAEIGKKLKP